MSANNSSRGKTEVTHVSFKPAKGGIVSETHKETKRGGQGGGPMHDYDTETAVHPTIESAHAHLTAMMGHAFAGKSEAKDEE